MIKKIISIIIGVGIITVIFGTLYAVVQQSYRTSANDPQIQVAEDVSHFLSQGGDIQSLADGNEQINFAQSIAPFVAIYDKDGAVLFSNGTLDGNVPTPPLGVLTHANTSGQNRVTWQPRSDVRIASVVAPYSYNGISGYVLAGRNLREVESRENQLSYMVFFGWLVSVAGFIMFFFVRLI